MYAVRSGDGRCAPAGWRIDCAPHHPLTDRGGNGPRNARSLLMLRQLRRCGRIAVTMVDSDAASDGSKDGSAQPSRRRHIVQLGVFAAFLFAMFYLVAIARVIDIESVRRVVAATGPLAPLTY